MVRFISYCGDCVRFFTMGKNPNSLYYKNRTTYTTFFATLITLIFLIILTSYSVKLIYDTVLIKNVTVEIQEDSIEDQLGNLTSVMNLYKSLEGEL